MPKAVDTELGSLQPMLQHSPRGVDPTDPLVRKMREITSKGSKKKSEADLAEQDWLEFQLALYWNGKYVYVPDTAIMGMIRDGARQNRRGREVQSGVDVVGEEIPLIYDGPKTPRELYDARFVDRRPAGIMKARVMRVRPRFNDWRLKFRLLIDDNVLNVGDVKAALEIGAAQKGLLDHRPRFGRCEVKSWKEVPA
jgi:hypothetical protein